LVHDSILASPIHSDKLGVPSPPLGALSHPGPGTPPGDRVNPDPSAYIRYGGMR